jgi:RHS repeat-associated protein
LLATDSPCASGWSSSASESAYRRGASFRRHVGGARLMPYDARTGRYVQSDPIGLNGGTSTYGYAGGNPHSNIDPLGLAFTSVDWACARDPGLCAEILGDYSGAMADNFRKHGDCERADYYDAAAGLFGAAGDTIGKVQLALGVARAVKAAAKAVGASSKAAPTSAIADQGYRKEKRSPNPVRAKDVVDRWNSFLGPGPHSNTHPRTGLPDNNGTVSAHKQRSISYDSHETNGRPGRHHYHEETWSWDQVNNVMNVDYTTYNIAR